MLHLDLWLSPVLACNLGLPGGERVGEPGSEWSEGEPVRMRVNAQAKQVNCRLKGGMAKCGKSIKTYICIYIYIYFFKGMRSQGECFSRQAAGTSLLRTLLKFLQLFLIPASAAGKLQSLWKLY